MERRVPGSLVLEVVQGGPPRFRPLSVRELESVRALPPAIRRSPAELELPRSRRWKHPVRAGGSRVGASVLIRESKEPDRRRARAEPAPTTRKTALDLCPGFVGARAVDRRDFSTGHPDVDRELASVVDRVEQHEPEELGERDVTDLSGAGEELHGLG